MVEEGDESLGRFHEVFLDPVGDPLEVAGDLFEPVIVVDEDDGVVTAGVAVRSGSAGCGDISDQLAETELHVSYNGHVRRGQLSELEPQAGIPPELRGPCFVRGLLVDLVLESGDVGMAGIEEGLPPGGESFEDIVQDHAGTLPTEEVVITDDLAGFVGKIKR